MSGFAGLALLAAGIAFAAFCWRFAWWRRTVPYRHPRILMYHMVAPALPGGRFNKLRVHPAAFERQLRYLVAHGWRFVFLSELSALSKEAGAKGGNGVERGGKTVALTFDDGYRDNFLAAHPLLVKYGAKATLFLVADRWRDWSTAKNPRHADGELGREAKLADADVRAMLASGVWELGAHTRTHALLPSLDAADRRREIAEGKAELEGGFDTPVVSFAYPFGIYGRADEEAVAAAGYRWAVTTDPGISRDLAAEAHALKRIKVSGKDGAFAFALRLRTGKRGARG